ncbi:TetR/AcrR family transcriptional regulator [Thalassotalea sp. M1531]|uniref:TetR/AcrR family transcriptional regulator n=1 Tax=Thalassotalea algicola TaxID=2716224 RepID=A0A7Y0LF33_9GAMM|nr:TetR/AcrR family transcriptional regulator [Thalassotalea algicola]NMP33128.1 TetR/AcrR family transcriptional regulator [Thalassotalea algicola]
MARPSLAPQRIEEILDALEVCILKHGIQATSLESIAETAGMKRTILRHYIGNRDDIICALSKRWRDKYSDQWQQIVAWLPATNRSEAMIDALFTVGSADRVNATIIGEAIFSEAKRLSPIKEDQQHIMLEFHQHVSDALKVDYPDASDDKVSLVSHGIYASYLMAESLLPLKFIEQVHQLKLSTKLLCSTLSNN